MAKPQIKVSYGEDDQVMKEKKSAFNRPQLAYFLFSYTATYTGPACTATRTQPLQSKSANKLYFIEHPQEAIITDQAFKLTRYSLWMTRQQAGRADEFYVERSSSVQILIRRPYSILCS